MTEQAKAKSEVRVILESVLQIGFVLGMQNKDEPERRRAIIDPILDGAEMLILAKRDQP